MKMYQLHAKQHLSMDMKTAWGFLSKPENLSTITPESMKFKVLAGAEKDMYAGQIIHYTVSPIAGFRTRWVTEITHLKQGSYFVDEQRFGPYKLWHHKHFIHETAAGVLIEDLIDYKPPFGWFGNLAHKLFIKKQLQEIFDHRAKKLAALFGEVQGRKPQLTFSYISK